MLVAGKTPAGVRGGDDLVARAMPSANVEWVEGGRLIDPPPAVLGFVDEVLHRRSRP
ncbi:MAG: hypothetical protein ACRDOS_11050 [Gaiellaceae bacterium]